MANTEMLVMLSSNSEITFTDYYSHAFVPPTQKTSTVLTPIYGISNSSGIFGQFSRALNPQYTLDTTLSIGLSTDFSFAYLTPPDLGFTQHDNIGIGLITFGQNNNTSSYIPNAGEDLPYLALDENFYIGWEFSSNAITFTFNVSYN